MTFERLTLVIAAVALPVLLTSCREQLAPVDPDPEPAAQVLLVAGDISRCTNDFDEATAKLLDNLQGTVMTAGDNAYPDGSAADYQQCYEPTWGRHKQRTWAVLGNHEYVVEGAVPSFDYFGERAGPRGLGYYSFMLGDWHVIVLNSNYPQVDTSPESVQVQWLRQELAAHAHFRCTMAVWHHPRFYQGTTTSNVRVRPFWDVLYEAGADLIVTGHHHIYERYARLDPDGNVDPERGIRQFIVGTGGAGNDSLLPGRPGVEARERVFGIMKFTLEKDGYRWEFVGTPGTTFTDSGSERCR